MESIDAVFKALGGYDEIARHLKLPPGTVSAWKTRKSIPSEYWAELVELARSMGKRRITFALLASLAARPVKKRKPESAARATT